jgi:hypothetical protein
MLLGAAPWLINWLFTGSPSSTTARVKWLVFSPYLDLAGFAKTTLDHLGYLFGELLDGHGQSALFLPEGSRPFALLGLLALAASARFSRQRWRALLTLLLALGLLLPTTYEVYIYNRLRYFWPFVPAWFVGIAVLIQLCAQPLERFHARAPLVARLALAAGCLLALGRHFAPAVDDLAMSSSAILYQQVWLAKWAKRTLPKDAVIGLNDAGALTYLSERRVFDIVGLTTRGEARFWAAGEGSRFEHYERLDRVALPTHFIVYRGWLRLDLLLGQQLTERTMQNASILGGQTMVACVANYASLGSGALPSAPPARTLRDELDVADLDSEAAHQYVLLPARKIDNYVLTHADRADGARSKRLGDEFELELEPGGELVLRVGAPVACQLRITADGQDLAKAQLSAKSWQEISITLPTTLRAGRHHLRLTPDAGAQFSSMHYWSFR